MENNEQQQQAKAKPNLRQAGRSNGPKRFVLAACLLAGLWMYPMIIRPLFSGGDSMSSADEKQLEATKEELRKHRPRNMPDWTSPFGPREGEE